MLPKEIQRQYARERERAINEAEERKRDAYKRWPRLAEIDGERFELALGLGLKLFRAESRDEVKRETLFAMDSLSMEKRRILREGGLDEGYLEPRFACEKCGDTGYTGGGELCPCAKLRLAGYYYASSGLDRKADFNSFDPSIFRDAEQRERTKKAAALCREYAEQLSINGAAGLLLMGETGLGKTFLMDCIGKRAIEMGRSVKKYTAYNMVDAMLRAMREREEGPELTGAELLLLDDLGTEPMVPGVTIETLFAAINERQVSKKATVIATNLTKAQILEQYGERLFSRLFAADGFARITLKGRDLRL